MNLTAYDRLFPSQDVLPSLGGIGNLIAACKSTCGSDGAMDALFEIDDGDVLQSWIGGRGRRRRAVEPSDVVVPAVRFAFYGRTSTAEYQDPVTSQAWQQEVATTLIIGHGTITAEFFDVGCSRRVSWERRPRASALLKQAKGVDRPFDAVVSGSSSARSPIASSSRSPGFYGGTACWCGCPRRVARSTSMPRPIGC